MCSCLYWFSRVWCRIHWTLVLLKSQTITQMSQEQSRRLLLVEWNFVERHLLKWVWSLSSPNVKACNRNHSTVTWTETVMYTSYRKNEKISMKTFSKWHHWHCFNLFQFQQNHSIEICLRKNPQKSILICCTMLLSLSQSSWKPYNGGANVFSIKPWNEWKQWHAISDKYAKATLYLSLSPSRITHPHFCVCASRMQNKVGISVEQMHTDTRGLLSSAQYLLYAALVRAHHSNVIW